MKSVESNDVGLGIETVFTYSELCRFRDHFIIGHNGFKIPFLIVVGAPGLSKSFQFENAPDACYINNAASAVGLYKLAYEHRNKPIILDDIDGLLKDRTVISLLKSLVNDREIREVTWAKMSTALKKEEIPNRFTTTSRLCILCNEFPNLGVNFSAVQQRATVIRFAPSIQEIHDYVGTYWHKAYPEHGDVYEFFGMNLHRINTPSIRWYNKARDKKLLGIDFKEWLTKQWQDDNYLLYVAGEIVNSGASKGKACEETWVERTGLGRASWYNYQKRYLQIHTPKGEKAETLRLLDCRAQEVS